MADGIGLTLDSADVLTLPPSIIIYGSSGVGKSTSVVQACQDALFIQASSDVLRPYETWRLGLTDAAERAKYKPLVDIAKKTIEPSDVIKEMQTRANKGPGSCWEKLEQILVVFEKAARAGTNPYPGIVFDEWSVFAARIFDDMKASGLAQFKAHSGKLDPFKVIDAIKILHRRVLELPARCGKYVVLVCHVQDPKYHDQDDETKASALRGKLKYRGGPLFPVGTLIDQIVPMSTFALHMVSEEGLSLTGDGGTRYFLTDGTELWARKARDFRFPAKIKVSEQNLRKLLNETAGLDL